MARRQQKKRRDRLFKACPFCYWCGCPVNKIKNHNYLPNSATLDHLYGRLDSRRHDPSIKNKTVLSCLSCNNRRGRIDELRAGSEKLRKQSQKHKD